VARLRPRSCIIDEEAVACNGMTSFDRGPCSLQRPAASRSSLLFDHAHNETSGRCRSTGPSFPPRHRPAQATESPPMAAFDGPFELRPQPIGNSAGDLCRRLVGDREHRTDVDLAKHVERLRTAHGDVRSRRHRTALFCVHLAERLKAPHSKFVGEDRSWAQRHFRW
jgi:hypothetical protein